MCFLMLWPSDVAVVVYFYTDTSDFPEADSFLIDLLSLKTLFWNLSIDWFYSVNDCIMIISI